MDGSGMDFMQKSKVTIGIQARSANTRLPGKCMMPINGVPMIECVLRAAEKSANYVNNSESATKIKVGVCLLTPHDDPIANAYRSKVFTIEGPEHDVLERYGMMLRLTESDYVVRITSDCPLIPSYVITGHIARAVKYQFDYVSNVHEACRTSPDGFDCEVISAKLLKWTLENATSQHDREHVTTLIRSNPPKWCRAAHIVSYTDLSHLKLSVDTEEDMMFVQTYSRILGDKIKEARKTAEGFFRL